MRKILLSLVFTAWMGLAWAATPKQVVLQVENMTCPACSITIEKALDTVPGVTAKRIDTRAATVTVAFDTERTNTAAIAKGIKFGDGSTSTQFALGDTINVKGDGNLTSTTTADGVKLGLGNSISIGSTNPVRIDGNAGTIGGLTNTTFNPNSIVSGQAATEDQLKAVSDVANTGWNLQTNADTAGKVAPGDTVKFIDGDNIEITRNGNDIKVATAKNLTADSITAGSSKLDTNGLTITGGPSFTKTGINAAGNKITNVAAGSVGASSTDAVNGSQLYEVAQKAAQQATVSAGDSNAASASRLMWAHDQAPNAFRSASRTPLAVLGRLFRS